MFDYINDNNNQNKLKKKKKNKKLILCLNLLGVMLLIGGGYGIKYIYDQKKDIEEAKLRQQELLASQQKKAKEITDSINNQKQEETKLALQLGIYDRRRK